MGETRFGLGAMRTRTLIVTSVLAWPSASLTQRELNRVDAPLAQLLLKRVAARGRPGARAGGRASSSQLRRDRLCRTVGAVGRLSGQRRFDRAASRADAPVPRAC